MEQLPVLLPSSLQKSLISTVTLKAFPFLSLNRIDGTLDGAVNKHRKQYHKVLKADPYFKDIAARSADTAHIKGKHPLLKDFALTDKSVLPKHIPGFAINVGDPNDMPAVMVNEHHGVNAVPGAICLEDHSKQKAAMSIGPHSASGAVCPTDHGEHDDDCEKDVVGWERVLQLPQ
ncbi:hypothetical protein CY35_15G032900 [Sphagnum magellanicum]|jgi:hypothetical protein|nr:hypothetical protein CY35_15G032900 [Sphagnum magellanicum]KAH9538925.1 hypothetical protein CY35_15G032900 [Sphagnum magellanicum]KAH9538927.1 hypothetical protein CY35_15G032900 [Sphagnum magellanicum]